MALLNYPSRLLSGDLHSLAWQTGIPVSQLETARSRMQSNQASPVTSGTVNIPGGLSGLPVYPAGERGVPGKPNIPSPFETQKTAIQGNAANLPDFTNLYRNLGSLIVGGDYPNLQRQEYANIQDMLRGTLGPRDLQVGPATAASRGIAGSPAGTLIDLFETQGQRTARQAAGSQLLSNAIARQVLPVDQWMVKPDANQYWEYLAALRNAAADPWVQYNQAAQAALGGLQAGARTQRPVSSGTSNYSFPSFSMPSAPTYTAPGRQLTPTLPSYSGPGMGAAWNDQGGYADTGNIPTGYAFPPSFSQPLDLNFGGGLDFGLINNAPAYNPNLDFGGGLDFGMNQPTIGPWDEELYF